MNQKTYYSLIRRSPAMGRFHRRSGITLLFVVSMIVLFLLMGTAFVLVSNNYKKDAKLRSLKDLTFDNGTELIEYALYEALVGPDLDNLDSPLRGHSILGDVYGYGQKAQVSAVPPVAVPGSGGQLIRLNLSHPADITVVNRVESTRLGPGSTPVDLTVYPNNVPGGYTGFLLTFTSGSARGITTRIVGYGGIDDAYAFTIAPAWGDSFPASTNLLAALQSDVGTGTGVEVVINGAPYSGYGAGGYSAALDLAGMPALGATALLPNLLGRDRATILGLGGGGGYLADNNGINEPYDAVDYQNMFLAGNTGNAANPIIGSGMPVGWNPSFHRQALINYHTIGGSLNPPQRYMFAVDEDGDLTPDHYADSDGDGVNDAVFIDIGLPVQSDESGRLFKPLVAYRIEDMDGKINLNAHGSLATLFPNSGITSEPVRHDPASAAPVGQGVGPAEVNFSAMFADASLLMVGGNVNGRNLIGRYGADGVPGGDSASPLYNWWPHKHFGYPRGRSNFFTGEIGTMQRFGGLTKFSSALDIHGRFSIVHESPDQSAQPDGYGQQFFDPNNTLFASNGFPWFPNSQPGINMLVSSLNDEVLDNPYEVSLSSAPFNGQGDQLFRPQELERVLRQFDRDSYSLPSRLWQLGSAGTGQFGMSPETANAVTTESWEITKVAEGQLLINRLAQRIALENGSTDPAADSINYLDEARGMLGPEVSAGLSFNINRPWGNGYDDNADGIVDNIDEMPASNSDPLERNFDQQAGLASAPDMELVTDIESGVGTNVLSRSVFAKNLYVLTLLTCEEGIDYNGNGTVEQSEEVEYRRRIAQWAINVVDFRDADSIHSPFEFDLNPFNGWDVDGVPGSADDTLLDRAIVWGMERPELLITETFAGHDGRTEDDGTGSGTEESRLMPNAFAYVELYNPWTQNLMSQSLPAELYRNGPNGSGVDVTLTTPNRNDSVWRLVACHPRGNEQIVRAFYLSNRYTFNSDPDLGSATQFSSSTGDESRPVPPGWSCVIGPPGFDNGDPGRENSFPFGRRFGITAADEPNNLDTDITRHISLDPDNDLIHIQPGDDAASEFSYRAVSVIVDSSRTGLGATRPMNLSDPRRGYPSAGRMPVEDGFAYTSPMMALDDSSTRQGGDEFTRAELDEIDTRMVNGGNGFIPNFRIIKLQRLANPNADFDPESNPYITIDRMSTNLVTYNGLQSASGVDLSSIERGHDDSGLAERKLWGEAGPKNEVVAPPMGTAAHYIDNELDVSLGATNDEYVESAFNGPFGVLTWNNRPFANPYELQNVPYLSSEELVQEYSTIPELGTLGSASDFVDNPYELPLAYPADAPSYLGGRFRHLLNFYFQEPESGLPGSTPSLFRLFDHIEVPSPFVGSEVFLNPSVFTANPFNFLTTYRQPGKINLNTVSHGEVWTALMGQYAGSVGFLDFLLARNNSDPDVAGYPTDVLTPFRPAQAANWVPVLELSPNGLPNDALVSREVDCGLLRSNVFGEEPLFTPLSDPAVTAIDPRGFGNRSAYDHNHMVSRLSNMTTDRSSVFSVWITVGYFEISPVDGSIIGEIGANTGENTRHRGFFLVDRSIPVAFEPGKRHNVDRAILVQSIIED